MRSLLHVASRGRYAVFADAGTFSRTRPKAGAEPEDDLPPEVQAGRDRGDAFLIHAAEGDCEFSVELFVDEAPPPELAKAKIGAKVEGTLLRLPSGRLTLTAEEDVFTALDQLDPETWSSVDLAPGSYSLSAYDLTAWKEAERERVVSANATAGEIRLHKIQNAAGCLAVAFLVSNLLVALPALFLLARRLGWKRALAWVLGVEVFCLGGLWVLNSIVSRLRGDRRELREVATGYSCPPSPARRSVPAWARGCAENWGVSRMEAAMANPRVMSKASVGCH